MSNRKDLFGHNSFKQIIGVSWGEYAAEKYPEYVELRELQHKEKSKNLVKNKISRMLKSSIMQ